MARIKTGKRRTMEPQKRFLAHQIRAGKAVPIISHALVNHFLFGDYARFMADYAAYLGYPDANTMNLAGLAQYSLVMDHAKSHPAVIKSDYLEWIKSRLYERAEAEQLPPHLLEEADAVFDNLTFQGLCNTLGYPRFGPPCDDPFLILARLPLPIYITTSFHSMMEVALRRAGKKPRSQTCLWSPELRDLPDVFASGYTPTEAEPLVFHLLGHDPYPDSLVLTQDDYMGFVVNVSREMGRQTDLIPGCLRHALIESSLLLLGYDLDAWDFHTLYWLLLKHRTRQNASVSVLNLKPDDPKKDYKINYLQSCSFEVFQGDLTHFVHGLLHDLEAS